MTPTTILIVSPSPLNRARITKMLAAVPGVDVIAVTSDLSETFMQAESLEPDVVVVSDEFRQSDEFNAMKSLFYALDARWIFVSGDVRSLPAGQVRGPGGRMIAEPVLDMTMAPDMVFSLIRQATAIVRTYDKGTLGQQRKEPQTLYDKIVVIGSSTGGVDALLTILSEFPADCPPTAIVQHTGKGFSDSLIRLLERRCKPQVVAAQDGLTLKQGMVCVAAGSEGHMSLGPGNMPRCQIRMGAPISGHTPSIDALFQSVLPLAPRVVGVILTGMGQDGAAGLLNLRRSGCITIGQDEASSVVYGMPKTAWDIGAVQHQLSVNKIGAEILRSSIPNTSSAAVAANRLAMR